ncbi:MAG: hypothetical protein SVN78_04500 [Deferribacterota bacterium]|nr:hypothetical protein [Deferribacterota bacterium]
MNSNYVRKIDNMTISYIDSSINKAIIAFTSARGINAIISMLKSSTVNLTPAGVGASISIGQVLDPVDDIIENLSNILLLSIVSLGIQRFLIEIAPFISFNIFLNLGLILLFFLIIIKNLRKSFLFNLVIKFFIVALVIEFILPFFVFIDWTTNKLFFEKEYESARYTLNETNEELTATYGAIFSTKGVIEGFKNFLKKENNGKNFIEQLKDSAEKIIESSLKLILIFILDTVIIPLFFLWLLYKFLKYIFNYNYLLKKP